MNQANHEPSPLAARLSRGMQDAKLGVDQLAERTKVPRSTLRALLGEDVNAVLPGRVYLRGHMLLAARELGIDEAEVGPLFDEVFPVAEREEDAIELPRFRAGWLAITAGLAGVGILAVVLAFSGG